MWFKSQMYRGGKESDTKIRVNKKRRLADWLYGTFQLLCLLAVAALFVYGQINNDIWSIIALVIGGILWILVAKFNSHPDSDSSGKTRGE
ncbi:hypothetical protein [Enterobacter mori]|jgi:hypothetical protein